VEDFHHEGHEGKREFRIKSFSYSLASPPICVHPCSSAAKEELTADKRRLTPMKKKI